MKVLIAGGDGYVGSVLATRLQHQVSVFDIARGMDITNRDSWARACEEMEAVIYLAGITNNDECEKDSELAKRINMEAFPFAVEIAKDSGVKRFIFASSVAAYGSSDEEMNETHALNPATLYGRYKAICEEMLELSLIPYVITRSASVCGWSPRMRNDLTVNKMVHDALTKGVITVNGGDQYRCHVHMDDLCDFYELLLEAPEEKVKGRAFNVVECNERILDTAQNVALVVANTAVKCGPATDDRSYKASGKKACEILNWKPRRHYTDAVFEMMKHHV